MKALARTISISALSLLILTSALGLRVAAQPAQASQQTATPTPVADVKPPELPPTNDPKEIVRRSVEADHRSW